MNLAGARAFHAHDQLEQGTFTRARVAGDKDHLADLDMKAQAIQTHVAIRVTLADLLETNHGLLSPKQRLDELGRSEGS